MGNLDRRCNPFPSADATREFQEHYACVDHVAHSGQSSNTLVLKQTPTFRRWHLKLRDETAQAIIADRLVRLANGLPGDVAPVGSGISELRIHFGPGYRVYFQRQGSVLIVLLCGGDKSTQSADIRKAKIIAEHWTDTDD